MTSDFDSSPPPSTLRGILIKSETQPGIRYLIERAVGEGGMGTAYLAKREGPDGSFPVVVKIMRSAGLQVPADLVASKEAVSLGRLNESVPPTPFVVRFVDAGSTRIPGANGPTPWIALEYVHGGVEGTTLEDRVTYSLHRTGYAFDSNRTAHAVHCLASGLSAIHAAGVIHRDLTPGNVLCCGFGKSEVFKISDFGLARASGHALTFTDVVVGTLGYMAPELGTASAGPASDVFSFAAIVYYLLTGQTYFQAENPLHMFRIVSEPRRLSITAEPALSPDLLQRSDACNAIDAALARATSRSISDRPSSAAEFAATILPALVESASGPLSGPLSGPRSTRRLLSAVLSARSETAPPAPFRWNVRSRPRADISISNVAWDTDGHALALDPSGARFYNGQKWLDADPLLKKLPPNMTFTERYEAGGWLVGGEAPFLYLVDARGVGDCVAAPNQQVGFSLASGRLDDLLVAVQHRGAECPLIWTLATRRWFRPIELVGAAQVTTLQRLEDARWLIGGRSSNGGGFAAVVSPLDFQVDVLTIPGAGAFTSGASVFDRSLALIAGSKGTVLRVEGAQLESSVVHPEQDLVAVAVNVLDREWAASRNALWSRDPALKQPWQIAWQSQTRAPFVSLMADEGMVVAMTADGGIIEGSQSLSPTSP